ncbi:MAG: gluconeogenesis factor YvcK family protein [Actinomycetota bacterium]
MKVVGIGGGHGLATTLRAARKYAARVAAVVTVADDGGSSGRLTVELQIPPPGDIRNCLVALSPEGPTSDLFQHRFERGTLEGHALGNLIIAALAESTGDFAEAVLAAGEMLGAEGPVYPATTELVKLGAIVDGGVVRGQVAVAESRSPIRSVHLEPSDPPAHPAARAEILAADQVVIGPGSLFTSVIAPLLIPGIRDALHDTSAARVFVCNGKRQKGETEGLDVVGHVSALLRHVGEGVIDHVVMQSPPLPDGVGIPVEWPFGSIDLVTADVMSPDGAHQPDRLAPVLSALGRHSR